MASPPLFDITKIDLTQVAASPERVGELIPQCGPMRQLDHVIWMNADFTEGLGVKNVRHDEFWVSGHVPGRPIMPGVLMIEAAAQLCAYIQKFAHHMSDSTFLGFTRCNDVVFRGQVVPGDTLYLLAKEISYRRRRFESAAQAIVNGQLVFEAKITGMAI